MLFSPSSKPKNFINAPVYHADCIIFDLEDSISIKEKDSARDLLCEAISSLDYSNCQICVRINSLHTPFGEDDVRAIVPAGIRFIRLAMCESSDDIIELDHLLTQIERHSNIPIGSVKIQASIETAKGVLNAREIVHASQRVISLSFGAEDYTRSMGTNRSADGLELSFARQYLPVVAAEAGITAIDTVWSDLENQEGFIKDVTRAKAFGFSGKSCIHPSQIPYVNSTFFPSCDEISYAKKVISAMREAEEKGIGVFTVDGKMVDEPVVAKAYHILMQAGERSVSFE